AHICARASHLLLPTVRGHVRVIERRVLDGTGPSPAILHSRVSGAAGTGPGEPGRPERGRRGLGPGRGARAGACRRREQGVTLLSPLPAPSRAELGRGEGAMEPGGGRKEKPKPKEPISRVEKAKQKSAQQELKQRQRAEIYALNRVMTELEQQQFDAFCKQMQASGE
uniref:Small vasohibin-binding protein n=1 Tax=Chrysemys picta bellii TaxID=8478 RepID=A0A8C3H9E8_CHRPI